MLKRKVTDLMTRWKATRTTQGLLVTGARQVGKTSSIEAFAAGNYQSVIKIDFVQTPSAVRIIQEARDLDDLLMRITTLASSPIVEGSTLLFFDEVQLCGDALTWMRYLAQDGRFDVVYSGAMLGIEAYNFRSLPVGTIDIIEMFPLDFEEFCWAHGVDDSVLAIAQECWEARTAVPDYVHDRLKGLFMRYVLVGGMPEAVQTFVQTSDTQAMRARQRSIVQGYRADVTRYVDNVEHAQRIKTIYDAIPAQLNKENRRFMVSGIDKARRFDAMRSDFDWLAEAGVAIPVKRVTDPVNPLGLTREDSFFKLYLNDVGLLFSMFSSTDVQAFLLDEDAVNFGAAFENVVAQELRAHGHEALHYYSATKVGEVDFLLESPATVAITPLEVKSGKNSRRHAALDHLMEVKNYHLVKPVVLHKFNLSEELDVTYAPIYMAAFL